MLKERLIVALDVPNAEEAREIVADLGDAVGAFKIGLQLFAAAGPALVNEIIRHGHKVFLDLKFHDIPNTAAKAGIVAARMGVWMFNVHALGGSEMMKRTVGEVGAACIRENLARPFIIGVTVLTSSDQSGQREVGIETTLEDEVLNLALLTERSGLDGVVASPHECRAIRDGCANRNFLVVTPGIRPFPGTNDDQKRVTTPASAISAGADYIVVGRPLLKAQDRRAAIEEILMDPATADDDEI